MKTSLGPAGDLARATVLVSVEPAVAFQVFTSEIDSWWRRGPAYRAGGREPGVLTFEPGVGGRLFERFDSKGGPRLVEMGRILAWEPPHRLVFEWKGVNFAPDEKTEVTVVFAPSASGTRVTVEHRGWSALPPNHPVRHRQDTAAFVRTIGLWWGQLLTGLREHLSPSSDDG